MKRTPRTLIDTLSQNVLILAIVILLILLGIDIVNVGMAWNNVTTQQKLKIELIAKGANTYLSETRQLVRTLGTLIVEEDAASQEELLTHVAKQYSRFTAIYLLDANGKVMVEVKKNESESLVGFDLSGEAYFEPAKNGKEPYFSDTFFSLSTEDVAVTVAQPIYEDDQFWGMLVAEMNLDELQNDIQYMKNDEAEITFMVDDRGTVIAHPDHDVVRQQQNAGGLKVIKDSANGPSVDIFYDELDHLWVVGSAAPIDNDWVVVTKRSVFGAMRPVINLAVISLFAFTFSALIFFFGSATVVNSISRPIKQLVDRIEHIMRGDYARADSTRSEGNPLEFANLIANFDHMASTVRERTEELIQSNKQLEMELDERHRIELALRESEQRFRLLFEGSPVAIWDEDFSAVKAFLENLRSRYDDWETCLASNPNLIKECIGLVKVVAVNQASLTLYGAESREQLIEHLYTDFDDETYDTFSEELRCIWDGQSHLQVETTFKTQAGESRYAIMHWTVLEGHENTYDRILVSLIDITARKQAEIALRESREHLEEMVNERTRELQLANQELESFAYTVSHDLRAPLRHVSGYSYLLMEDHKDKFDEDGRLLLSRIVEGANNMARLIEGLLQLSRVTRGELNKVPVDLASIAQEIVANLKEMEPGRQVSFKIVPECWVEGNPAMLRAAMQNLLSNAWKFTEKNPNALIEFGIKMESRFGQHETTPVYFVRDNGVGFDMVLKDKLFTPFQRLHTEREFQGTGIGLATVQRIIHKHGGRIWAEAEAGQGATFYFTL